uniref:InlB B-repeat-containing protein n=1 Tax=uncultured Tenacibaculum sp. TaxID=174713 RepID=UPI00262B9265
MKKIYFILLLLSTVFSINAQIVNIPDANFKDALLNHSPVIDTNVDGEIQVSEAEALTSILKISDGFSTNIKDLTGLEAFINLTNLDLFGFSGLNTTTIDVSSLTELTTLSLLHCKLSSLDVSQNTKLTSLTCGSNNISNIDISNNLDLEKFNCSANNFISVNLSNNIKLEDIDLAFNQITSLDLTPNTSLIKVSIRNNKLQNLNLNNGNNTAITSLDVSNNLLSCIKVDNVTFSSQNSNWIKDEYPTYNTSCSGNEGQAIVNIPDANFKKILVELTTLNINNDTEIQEFEAYNYTGDSDDLRINDTELIENLTGIEAFIRIGQLYLNNTKVSALDLSANKRLYYLSIQSNKSLINLNVSQNTNLRTIHSSFNDISQLDLSNNINLETFSTTFNDNISNIDLSNNINLKSIRLRSNPKLKDLNLANGNNTNITSFSSKFNNALFCIQVDNETYSINNWTDKDDHSSFNNDCSNVFTLTLNSSNGSVAKTPDPENINNNDYDNGTNVTLTATPNAGYQFDGWSGDASGTTNPLTITMDADKTVTAVFSKIQHTLTTNATNGTIARNPNTPSAGTYDFGTDVVLTATPNAGYQFDGWSGDASGTTNPLTITMDADKTVTAVFSKIQHTLTTNATKGTISRNPNTPTAGTYDFGTDVVLTATPNA